jgi:preprotein translocase subunit SecY
MAAGFQNIGKIPELRRRILFTITLLAVYRIGAFVTTPGVNRAIMGKIVNQASGTFLGLFNMFSGGALEQMSIFALGIMPYISASIILQLLTVVVPKLEQVSKEGEMGQRKINQYTRYGCVVLSLIQSFFIARWLEGNNRSYAQFGQVVTNPGWGFRLLTMISLTTGTAFIMWLGERITERGIGNGISLIIFAGIVARLPSATSRLVELSKDKAWLIPVLTVFMLLVVGVVVYIERGMRRIPVQYAKRMAGRTMFAGQATYFPMKVNTSGVIPPIFAGAILSFPATLGNWLPGLATVQHALEGNAWLYDGVFVLLIIFFTYFYTTLTFRADDVADNIKKQGGYIPGIRPGRQTAEYISGVLNRITFGGAIYLALICVIPSILSNPAFGGLPFQFGGTALLIVVGVALDTVQQIEGHLISRNYEGFAGSRGPRIRGRMRPAA